jgi:serine/threonine-protein kinase
MPSDERPLVDLAARVADGRIVDWEGAVASSGADLVPAVRELRIIGEIAALHRRWSGSPDATSVIGVPEATASVSPIRAPRFDPDAKRWGPLVVMESIGSGAFGDVYRAWDTTLDREVALKLLKRPGSAGAAFIAREGQLLARVSHPNVMAIYGALQIDGQVGIWGELLRGRTLARMVSEQGPLSAEETLLLSDAICRALATAHRSGLLHRDVKAQNVMREAGGRIVLMDFGLGRELSDAPTSAGVELAGTPLYLAPELFSGGRASVRSDIYSLGVLMFFLVTGNYPITGRRLEDIASGHASGTRQRLQDLRPELANPFVQVVERAIEIEPARRFESCGAMQSAIAAAAQPMREPVIQIPRGWQILIHPLVAATALLAIVAGALFTLWLVPDTAVRQPTTVALSPPGGTQLADSSRSVPAVSPDGRYVAFVAVESTGENALWRQDLQTGEALKVANSLGALEPFWGPQVDHLGFFEVGGRLRWGSSDGTRVDGSVATASEPRGAAWSSSGIIAYAKGTRSDLFQFSLATGQESLLLARDATRGELGLMYPQFLPDGKRFIYFVFSHDARLRGVYLSAVGRASGVQLAQTDASAIVAGDRLLYLAGTDLVARRLGRDNSLVGETKTVARNVAANWDFAVMAAATAEGALVYLPDGLERTNLVWFDRKGAEIGVLPLDGARHRSPAISRDGRYVAVQRYAGTLSQIEVFDIEMRRRRLLIETSAEVEFPTWGRGHQLLYTSIDDGHDDIWFRDIDDDQPASLLFGGRDQANIKLPTSWSPDGRHVVFHMPQIRGGAAPQSSVYELYVLDAITKVTTPFRAGNGVQTSGIISPDGLKVTYRRRQPPKADGPPPNREIWVCDFPSGANAKLVAVDGVDPNWASNTEISYFDHQGRLAIVKIPQSSEWTSTIEPFVSFPVGVAVPGSARNNYWWSPDGSRVLVNRPFTDGAPLRLRLMLNWGAGTGISAGSSVSH